ncbi:MAG: hypothetical protein ABSA11_06020 [Candidatus Bathyarchaeia archaeon]|jgi:hypothetical protein
MSYSEENLRTVERLKETIGKENVLEIKTPRDKRIFVRVKIEKLRESISYLKARA